MSRGRNGSKNKILSTKPQLNSPDIKLTTISPQVGGKQRLVEVGAVIDSKRSKTETLLSDVDAFFEENLPAGKSHNDLSIGFLLELGQVKGLLMADIEQEGELSLQKIGLLSKVEILKVGHHGAKTSTSREFLEVVRPELAVISVGANNSYGHPAPQVLSLLAKFSTQVLRTDQQGDIELVVGSETITINHD